MAGAPAICVALSRLLAFAGVSVFIYSGQDNTGSGEVNSFLRARSLFTACTSMETRKGKYRERVKSVSPKA